MISHAKLEANRRNAKKSTGPRSPEGKRRSALNAMKHGITARIPLLPDEDARAYNERMVDWNDTLKPANGVERLQVRRAVHCSWQLDRVQRAQAALLCARAHNEGDDKRNREQVEVTELALQLLWSSGGTQSGEEEREDRSSDEEAVAPVGPTDFDASRHPAILICRLESSKLGCMWLLEQWSELASILESSGSWLAPARFKAMRLSGTYPGDPLRVTGINPILRACKVLDPTAADLACVLSPPVRDDVAERSDEAVLAEEARARQELLAVVEEETERIEARLVEHEERAELDEMLSNHILAYDESPEAERLRRYELTCHRYAFQTIDQFRKRERERKTDRHASASRGIDRSQYNQVFSAIAGIHATRKVERPEPADRGGTDSAEIDAPVVARPMPGCEPAGKSATALRNEPTARLGDESVQTVSRIGVAPNETKVVADSGKRFVRNEPTAERLAGPHRGNSRAKFEAGSRRDRRARRAKERANGGRELEKSLGLGGGPGRNLLLPVL
jgi:hypothetical protein